MFAQSKLAIPFLVAIFLPFISSAPVEQGCTNPAVRVNWNSLTEIQKEEYYASVKCLQTKPSKNTVPEARNQFDDFVSLHVKENTNIHFNAHFLPWHRKFVLLREQALKDCGYTGPTPYWDWTEWADKNDVMGDPFLSPTTGFGGNGTGSNNVVQDGPFKNLALNIAVAKKNDIVSYKPHLLQRDFNNGAGEDGSKMLDNFYNSTAVNKIMALDKFTQFAPQLESGPHGAIHSAIGGDMSPAQSPNDPIFFLHHAQVDRLWTLWQQKDPKRLTDFGGNLPGASSEKGPFDASLNDVLPFDGLAEDSQVRQLMDTQANGLCYTVGTKYDLC